MDLYRAHAEAHRLEHGMSPEVQTRLMERLGFPTRSPFGRPIPGAGGTVETAAGIPLDTAPVDETYVVDRVPEDNMDLLRFLVDSLIIPEQEIRVVEATPYLGVMTIATARDRISLGYQAAAKILVRSLQPVPAPAEG
jgi:DtxR family Mn-dependent transcriptional regulator